MPPSPSEPSVFERLDPRIQRWIWDAKWTTLREVQVRALPALLPADHDVILSAATAAGKTEAAFFPILTRLLQDDDDLGCVVCVSPLKALINDQMERLSALCEVLDVPLVAWHGDIGATRKHRFHRNPRGVLLITPESLEALFVTRGSAMPGLLAHLRYLVVDELHAFIGEERGKQLQSLLRRAELAAGRRVPRVGLSATLGDMGLAASFLRPESPDTVEVIEAGSGGQTLKVRVFGFEQARPGAPTPGEAADPNATPSAEAAITDILYRQLRHSNNLVFPNARAQVEAYADRLRRRCEQDGVPNAFWAHHGSLSKELREETERGLKDGTRPATAICTMTLEMGIDIGHIQSIAQIGPPPSVAALRQRLGRSGRRAGEAAILRGFCVEPALTPTSGVADRLREGLLQMTASIRLLLAGWCEPPRPDGLHASTLVQQILSLVAEQGGIRAGELWRVLLEQGPFANLTKHAFLDLLRHLGTLDLLMQDSSGLLLHGARGERLVQHYEFYSAFQSEDELTVVSQGKTLGTLSVSYPLAPGQGLIFGGRRWRVQDVDAEGKRIRVLPDAGGAVPFFPGAGPRLHDRVRQEMRVILAGSEPVDFLNPEARRLLTEARAYYRDAGLAQRVLLDDARPLLLTWRGDALNDTLVQLLRGQGVVAVNEGLGVRILQGDERSLGEVVRGILAKGVPTPEVLLDQAKNLAHAKWDWALPEPLLQQSYASLHLDPAAALAYLAELEPALG